MSLYVTVVLFILLQVRSGKPTRCVVYYASACHVRVYRSALTASVSTGGRKVPLRQAQSEGKSWNTSREHTLLSRHTMCVMTKSTCTHVVCYHTLEVR